MCNICNCVSGFHISEDSVNQSGKQILSQISSSKSRMSCYTKCKTLILIKGRGCLLTSEGRVQCKIDK